MIGMDIITLARMTETIERSGPSFLKRVFSSKEQFKAHRLENPIRFYASAFAAKEAVFKALDLGWQEEEVDFREIQIDRSDSGKPIIHLSGRVAERAKARGYHQLELSISYETDLAIAMVMARSRGSLI